MMNRPTTDERTGRFKWLIDLIPTGQHEAISMTDLSKLIGLPASDVRQMILNARKSGVLICSGEHGYYFPETPEELTEYILRRKQYIRTACVALQPFNAKAKTLHSEVTSP